MLRKWCLAILLVALLALAPSSGQEARPNAELEARINRLIEELDADDFQTRASAEKALLEIGEAAGAAVALAAKDDSPERRQRAMRVLRELRKAGFGLRHLASVKHELLLGAVDLSLSPDGKFLYAPGWKSSALHTFAVDATTGGLTHVASLADAEQLGGVVSLQLSPDGKLAAAASFRSKTLSLLSRDTDKGTLSLEAVQKSEPERGVELRFPTDAAFSPDSKFLYAVDDAQGAILVFDVAGKRLRHVETQTGKDACLAGARGIALSPDGKSVYAASFRAGTISVFDRNLDSGRVTLLQVLTDERDDIHALAGAFSVLPTSDGKFVYTTSGRFQGDQAVCVFRVGDDRKLSLLQEFINDQGDFADFQGGNQLAISPDGRNLYASGTVSGSLVCFRRDPDSGKLTFISAVKNEATGAGMSAGANGIEFSRDGRFLYLAVEDASSISIFERKTPQP